MLPQRINSFGENRLATVEFPETRFDFYASGPGMVKAKPALAAPRNQRRFHAAAISIICVSGSSC
jgi:hypothetical protein